MLACDIPAATGALSPPPDVLVELVADVATLRAATLVRTAGWGQPVPGEPQFAADLTHTLRGLADGSEFKVVAWIDGEPVATGGCEIADRVARLWGAVTLPGHRRRGAYRAVLGERLRIAARNGADLALVQGRTESSAPILARAGFTACGEERRYLVSSGSSSR